MSSLCSRAAAVLAVLAVLGGSAATLAQRPASGAGSRQSAASSVRARLANARRAFDARDFAMVVSALEPVAGDPVLGHDRKTAAELYYRLGYAHAELRNAGSARRYLERSVKAGDATWSGLAQQMLGSTRDAELQADLDRVRKLLETGDLLGARAEITRVTRVASIESMPTGAREDFALVASLIKCMPENGRVDRRGMRQCLDEYLSAHPHGVLSAYAAAEKARLSQPKVCYVEQGKGIIEYRDYDSLYPETLSAPEQGRVEYAAVAADARNLAFLSHRDRDWHVYLASMDGASPRRVWTGLRGSKLDPNRPPLLWSPSASTPAVAFAAETGTGDYAVYVCTPDMREAKELGGSAAPRDDAAAMKLAWSPEGNYVAFLDRNRALRIATRDGASVGSGGPLDTRGEVSDFRWARAPGSSEPVVFGLTGRGVFRARKSAAGVFEVEDLNVTVSASTGPAASEGGDAPRTLALLVTSAKVSGQGRERSVESLSLSCRSDAGLCRLAQTALYASPGVEDAVRDRVLKHTGGKSGQIDLPTDKGVVVDVQYGRLVFTAGASEPSMEAARIVALRTDVPSDGIAALSDLKAPAPKPEAWSQLGVSADGRNAALYDEAARALHLYQLSPTFEQVATLRGISTFEFAPNGPLLAVRRDDRVLVVADPRNPAATAYEVEGMGGRTRFQWSRAGNELVCWAEDETRVQCMYIGHRLYGCSGPRDPAAAAGTYQGRPQCSPDAMMVAFERAETYNGTSTVGIYILRREQGDGSKPDVGTMVRVPVRTGVSLVGWLW